MRRIASLLVFIGLFVFQTTGALAAGEDVFVVPRVPVQAQADSATAAKANAQSAGRRRAMDILLRRLTPEEDWVYLPNLATGAPATAGGTFDGAGKSPITISPRDLEALESGFEVYSEKSSSTIYRAYITYRFKPDAIRHLLKQAGLPYSEAQTRVALVLPVLQTDSGIYLWESNNPWMSAWKARPYTHELTPMSAPLGDLDDAASISPRQALALDVAGLQTLAERYNVSQVIVAHARLRQKDGVDQLTVRLINAHRESGKALASEFSVDDIVSADEQETFGFSTPDEDFATTVGEAVAQTYLTQPSGNFPAMAEQAIESVIAKYASGWKQRTLIDHSKQALLPVSAFFDRIEDWSKIRSALIATPLVGSVQVSSLSRRGAEMDVRVFGEPSRVQVAMENQGIVFWTETGERWFMATPSVAGKFRGKRFLRSSRFSETDDQPSASPYSDEPYVPASDYIEDERSKVEQ
jgi:hypothetical protein